MPKEKVLSLMVLLNFLFVIGCNTGKNDNLEKKEIAVFKYVTHPALDEMESAYIQYIDSVLVNSNLGSKYYINKYNANGAPQTANSIAQSFFYKKVGIIFTIATPASMAVSKMKSDTPFIYGAVADPKGAGIIPSKRATGIQNAGEGIVIEALRFMRDAFPNSNKIGTIYNSGEQNSVFVQEIIKRNAKKYGFEVLQISVNGTGQLSGVTEALCEQVDIIYSANDNTVNAGVSSVVSICNKKKVPFVIGDLSTLHKGPLYAIGLEYGEMGRELAVKSVEVLRGKEISSIPPEEAPQPKIWINDATRRIIAYNVPNEIVEKKIDKLITD